MTALRHGFKTEANARQVREELGLQLVDPLDPWRLANHLAIPVVPLSDLGNESDGAVRHLLRIDPGSFSAVTVFYGTERMIVHNDGHAAGRQSSNLAHELSHGLLLHPPTPPLAAGGCRDWDPVVEEEAEWVAGVLLISDEAAIQIVREGLTLEAAASRYRVSVPMVRFRINVTGARKRVARGRGRRKRPLG